MGHRCCGTSRDVSETGVLREEHGSLNGALGTTYRRGAGRRRTTPWRECDSEREQEGVR
jgi:hypothetical protein